MNYKVIFLFFFLLLVFNVNAQILDERTENNCNASGVCTWEQTMSKRFHNHDGEFLYFDQFVTSTSFNNVLGQNSLSNTQVSLTPVLNYNNIQYDLSDVPTLIGNQINYNTFVNPFRDETKFTVSLNAINGLNRIGYRVQSNQPIRYMDYNYTPSGVYYEDSGISINPFEIPSKPTPIYYLTDLIIGDLQYSFVDLIESGFNATYDKRRNILWIYLNNHSGLTDLDPIYSFYSDSTDGSLQIIGGVCDKAIYNNTLTMRITDDNVLAFPADMSQQIYLMFNTSTIAEDDTILASQIKTYAHAYYLTKRYVQPVWNVYYYNNQSYIGTLDCGDLFTSNYEGVTDWEQTTGFRIRFVNISGINTTGYTNYRLLDGWTPPLGKYAYVEVRASEYAGTDSDPTMLVLYEEAVEDVEDVEDVEEEGYWFMGMMLNVMFFVGFLSVYYLKKYKNEWE